MKRPIVALSLLSLSLTLSSCGQQAKTTVSSPSISPTIPPATSVLGAVELMLDADGGGEARSVRSPLGAQAALPNGAITLKRLSGGSFDDDSTGLRHLYVTFEVTNTTATAFKNLTFTAYSKAGSSVGGTAFQGITNFGGGPVSDVAVARSIKPEHNMRFTPQGSRVDLAQADFQAVTSSEAVALETGALANGTILAGSQVLEYGFVARNAGGGRSIPAQGKGQITIALALPKRSDITQMPFRFNATWVLSDEGTTRVTRGPGETTAEVVSRAQALGGTSVNKTQVMLVGTDTDTVSCTPADTCTSTRLTDVRISTVPTFLRNGDPNDVIGSLNLARPRLFFGPGEVPHLKAQIGTNATLSAISATMDSAVSTALAEPRFTSGNYGDNDLTRKILRQTSNLAGAWLLKSDATALARAKQNALDIAQWSSWGDKGDFVNTSSLLIATSLAYDWLYDQFSSAERAVLKTAIIDKGIKVGQGYYDVNWFNPPNWARSPGNWGQICNAAMGIAALTLANEEPALARSVLSKTRTNIPVVMGAYAPDGGYHENVTYNSYGLKYNIYLIEALRSALNTDWGLLDTPGLAQNPLWRMHMITPINKIFNFGDADEPVRGEENNLWLAQTFANPLSRDFDMQRAPSFSGQMSGIFGLLFTDTTHTWAPVGAYPDPVAAFRGIDVAALRSAWNDSNAFYVGLKGGDNGRSHAHLDLGSVVFDALGQRWGIDPGKVAYVAGAFDEDSQAGGRWKVYRARTEGHNTLAISAQPQEILKFANQWYQAKAPIVALKQTPARSFAVANLTEAYKGTANGTVFDARQVTKALRGVALLNSKQFLVQDDVTTAGPAEVIWQWHTKANVSPSGNVATLTLGGKTMQAKILSPAGAIFQVHTPTLVAPDVVGQNNGKNMTVRVTLPSAQSTRIAVLFSAPADAEPAPALEPLENWIAAGPLP